MKKRDKTKDVLYQITVKGICFSIRVNESVIIDAGPSARWTEGRDFNWFLDYIMKRGGTFKRLP